MISLFPTQLNYIIYFHWERLTVQLACWEEMQTVEYKVSKLSYLIMTPGPHFSRFQSIVRIFPILRLNRLCPVCMFSLNVCGTVIYWQTCSEWDQLQPLFWFYTQLNGIDYHGFLDCLVFIILTWFNAKHVLVMYMLSSAATVTNVMNTFGWF